MAVNNTKFWLMVGLVVGLVAPVSASQVNCDLIPSKVAQLTCKKNQAKIKKMEEERAQKREAALAEKAKQPTYKGRVQYQNGRAENGGRSRSRGLSEDRSQKKQKKAKRYQKNSHAARMSAKRTARREAQAKRRDVMQEREKLLATQAAKKVEQTKKQQAESAAKRSVAVDKNVVKSFKVEDASGGGSEYQDLSGLQVSSDEGDGAQPNSLWSYY